MIFRNSFSLAVAIAFFVVGCQSQSSSSTGSASAPSGSGSSTPSSTAAPGNAATVHQTPVCATQDCSTAKVIDNGCTPSGECASCINYCPPKGSITIAPSSLPLSK